MVNNPIDDGRLAPGAKGLDIRLSNHFSDEDVRKLTYTERVNVIASTSTSREDEVVTAEITGSRLTVTPVSTGSASVTVRATDPGNLSVTDEFVVTVAVGCAITLDTSISDKTLASDGYTATYTLPDHFSSTCQSVTYTVDSDNDAVATARISVSGTNTRTLTVTSGSTTADATITVTASGLGASPVSDEFDVTVTEKQGPRSRQFH